MYKATFDSSGNRLTSYCTDVHTLIPVEAISITDEEQSLYVTNEYIRGADGKPVKKVVIPPTPEEIRASIVKDFTSQVQTYLDAVAQTRNYDSMLALCSYATSLTPKFKLEGQAGVEWRDAVWTKCYEILAEVEAGTRGAPTDLISELPTISWNSVEEEII